METSLLNPVKVIDAAPSVIANESDIFGSQSTEATSEASNSQEEPSQENKQEAATIEEQQQETTKEERISPKLALLAKQRKEFEAQKKAHEEQVKQFNEALETARKDPTNLPKALKTLGLSVQNPIKALELFGYTLEDAAQFLINNEQPTPEMIDRERKNEIQALREEMEQERQLKLKREKEAEERAYQETVNRALEFANQIVDENPEKYELLKATDNVGEVIQALHLLEQSRQEKGNKFYRKDPYSIEEALDLLEEHLQQEAESILKLKKFQNKSAVSGNSQKAVQSEKATPKTLLTNKNTASSTKPKIEEPEPEFSSDRERIQYIIEKQRRQQN